MAAPGSGRVADALVELLAELLHEPLHVVDDERAHECER